MLLVTYCCSVRDRVCNMARASVEPTATRLTQPMMTRIGGKPSHGSDKKPSSIRMPAIASTASPTSACSSSQVGHGCLGPPCHRTRCIYRYAYFHLGTTPFDVVCEYMLTILSPYYSMSIVLFPLFLPSWLAYCGVTVRYDPYR